MTPFDRPMLPSGDGVQFPWVYSVGYGGGLGMQFVLTYDGVLKGSNDVQNKHELRQTFHPQLSMQWTREKTLVDIAQKTGIDSIASSYYRAGGFRFVPLVTKGLDLACQLDIKVLRPEEPGNVILTSGAVTGRSGVSADNDNRINNLFDGLSVPKDDQIRGYRPKADQEPFFCLLEDDSLVAKYSVTTERWLRPVVKPGEVSLMITVRVYPQRLTEQNKAFLGGYPS